MQNTNEQPPAYEKISKTKPASSKSIKSHSLNINKYLFSNRSGKTESSSSSLSLKKPEYMEANQPKTVQTALSINEPHEWREENGTKSNTTSPLGFAKSVSFQGSIVSLDCENLLDTSRLSQSVLSSRRSSPRVLVTPHEWRNQTKEVIL